MSGRKKTTAEHNADRKENEKASHKKHECRFCDKECYKKCIGPHLFKSHADDMKKLFERYKKIRTPVFPIESQDLYVCFCCKEVWDKPGWALSHMKTSPTCTAEAQLRALYEFIEHTPADEVVFKIKEVEAVKDAEKEVDLAVAQMNKAKDELQKRLSEANTKTKRLEQKIAYLEFLYVEKSALFVAQRDIAFSRLSASEQHYARKDINAVEFDADTKYELLKLKQDIEMYVDNTFQHDNLKIINEIIEPEAVAPEPVAAPEPVKDCMKCKEITHIDNKNTFSCKQCNKSVCKDCKTGTRPVLCSSDCYMSYKIWQRDNPAEWAQQVLHEQREKEALLAAQKQAAKDARRAARTLSRCSQSSAEKPVTEKPVTEKPVTKNVVTETPSLFLPGPVTDNCGFCHAPFFSHDEKKKCVSCDRVCHVDDKIANCWLNDCQMCSKVVCTKCVRGFGATRRRPVCSAACKTKYDDMYVESRPDTVVYVPKTEDNRCKRAVALNIFDGHGPAKTMFNECCSQACSASFRREFRRESRRQ